MRNKNILNGGYIGLLMLLIGVAIIIFIIFRNDIFLGQTYSVEKESSIENNKEENMIDQGNYYIGEARKAKDLLEENSRQKMEEE